jgi:autoinducer 2 (AI-2) kinase
VPVVKESTALGAAIYAGIGAGLYDDLAAVVAEVVQMERTVEPGSAAHARYGELYEQWLELYGRSLELSETGIVQPLWRAAGT